ncbi:hypothetical protein [Thermoanaerobacter siderophilus]|uniref:Uncharacterized protein n=1 Tax=Thermoanaerobacter siderophilus SR4 TaxID=880478 RepID=I8QZ45_9THEO|nr:hypothetical protein [Thermoanaerobacter siderophilus]EIW00388.1 hypothetical protein ThesiDRAFT1_1450 [Thermoanaerobacter siderophilus SR4]
MEKYFVIISIISVVTLILLLLVLIAFVKWTDRIFGIENEKEGKNDKDKKKK